MQDRIVEFIRANPGCSLTQVCGGVRGRHEKVAEAVRAAAESGDVENRGTERVQKWHAPADPVKERIARKQERSLKNAHDDLLDRLAEAESRTAFVRSLAAEPPPPRIVPHESHSGMREACAVAMASDWHVEEEVDPRTVAGRNAYNLDVAERRVERYFDGVLWLIRHHRNAFTIRDLLLWLGGDLFTGHIHPENVETSALAPVQSVLLLKGWLARGIRKLLNEGALERMVIVCNYGNHGRTTEKRRIATGAQNSFEWLLYNVLRDELNDQRIEWRIAFGAHEYAEVYGRVLHFHHGDEVRYQGGVGGISIPLLKRVAAWNTIRPAYLSHVGHYHQLRLFKSAIANGSLIGMSPYGVSVGASFEEPEQGFYLLDSRRGLCEFTPVWVTEGHS